MIRHYHRLFLGCAAAAMLLSACGQSGSSSSSGGLNSATDSASSQTAAYRTGLGVVTTADAEDRVGKITTTAAAVLLDGEGKICAVVLDELESSITADGSGTVKMPSDWRTKRQMGKDYPLDKVSSLNRGWAEQADAFGSYLVGMTPEQASKLETDEEGRPKDPDLVSGCTIAVEPYRQAVEKACANARALGAAQGDRLTLGIHAENGSSGTAATDDQDLDAQVDFTVLALTMDAQGHVTSAVGDMAEPALTISADGGIDTPDRVQSKQELGDSYGMRGASALGKEWYEHAEGYCSYLRGKTAAEIRKIPADGSDADLASLCTIEVDAFQKAALDALQQPLS